MREKQELRIITIEALTAEAQRFFAEGYRLVQVGATALDAGFEINYSFDKDFQFVNLRIRLDSVERPVPSVSGIYWNAFLYENEIHDLFGIRIKGMAVDYHGHFYTMAVQVPFGSRKVAEGNKE